MLVHSLISGNSINVLFFYSWNSNKYTYAGQLPDIPVLASISYSFTPETALNTSYMLVHSQKKNSKSISILFLNPRNSIKYTYKYLTGIMIFFENISIHTSWRARRCLWKKNFCRIKFWKIYIYIWLVLLYRL